MVGWVKCFFFTHAEEVGKWQIIAEHLYINDKNSMGKKKRFFTHPTVCNPVKKGHLI